MMKKIKKQKIKFVYTKSRNKQNKTKNDKKN